MKCKILLKKHEGVIAICDSGLVGKSFQEGKLQLDVTERFYKGEPLKEGELIKIMQLCPNLNIVGKESIKLGLKSGAITKESIILIQGIPHAQKFSILP